MKYGLQAYFLGIFGIVCVMMPFSVNANWYTPAEGIQLQVNKDAGRQWCPEDAHRDAVGPKDTPPQPNPDGVTRPGYYQKDTENLGGQARVVGIERRGGFFKRAYMKCEQWDSTKPSNGKINYKDGWTNERNIKISLSADDIGGSVRGNNDVRIEVEYKTAPIVNGDNVGTYSSWKSLGISPTVLTVNGNGTLVRPSKIFAEYDYTVPPTRGTAYKFRFRIYDRAGNLLNVGIRGDGWLEGTPEYKLDTVPPDLPAITTKLGGWNFYAGERDPLIWICEGACNPNGSPVDIYYEYEDDDNPRKMNSGITGGHVIRSVIDFKNRAFFNVGNNGLDLNYNIGGRELTIKQIKVVDKAGNERKDGRTWNFYIFADIDSADVACMERTGKRVPCVNGINSTSTTHTPQNSGIADGQKRNIRQSIVDKYGNPFIPAARIGRTIERYVSTNRNTMYLNQKLRDGASAVFFEDKNSSEGEKSLPIVKDNSQKNIKWTNLKSPFGGQPAGDYNLNISVYTPTANAYGANDSISDPEAGFNYSYWLQATDDTSKIGYFDGREYGTRNPKIIGQYSVNNPQYSPLFTNEISGNIRDGGFIEGVNQENILKITKNPGTSVNPNPKRIYAEYSGDNANNFTLSREFPIPKERFEKNDYKQFIENFSIGDNNFTTFLKQKANQVSDTSKMFFSTHFVYNLNGKNVTYNGDVIGKKSYFGAEETNQGNQVGVKIIGTANDARLNFILNNQENNIHSVNISSVSSAEVRNEIRRSVALATRNLQLENAGKNIVDVANIPSGSGVKAGIITHDGGNSSILLIQGNGGRIELNVQKISGKRTIVVQNADLYIKKDMYYDRLKENSILGVVVQKGENGGGNLYIDTSITNVVGTYVLDGSVFSMNNGQDINIGKISELKNQLYIFGSLISYNTIGGARANPVTCPAVIPSCTQDNAQKYDLNYLRRYYLFEGKPMNGAKIIGGGEYNRATGQFLGTQSNLRNLYDNDITHDFAKYPVIIEYNPMIVTGPPIGFDIFRD